MVPLILRLANLLMLEVLWDTNATCGALAKMADVGRDAKIMKRYLLKSVVSIGSSSLHAVIITLQP